MKYIIIEDEPLAAGRVKQFAGKLPYLQFGAVFEKAVTAMEYLRSNQVDLIFLDINIGEISGIRFLEIARPDCAVIILSAYQDYALQGFEMQVTDYLLKPFTFERFYQAVERARSLQPKPELEKAFIFVKTQYRLEKVMLGELLYIEGARDYRRIHTTKQVLMTLQTFGELEKDLPQARFIRVHKSYLVALDKIESLEKDFIRIADRLIPVSEKYKKMVLAKLK
ncbi:LytR/AlgR family response regulator transcription factor [Mucilaginibacter psychrotolerans]|uniref:Response regulator transcription factor n=1 Tax=Mucilaginibacter psychrotolerans TaxID=1524096 RepID=A0A4Y8S3W2_9SPHI|nr:LytTR family DNA-binding domain-containing protein [Mucilaginibacter psychrotolerans]TFF33638.1 response regulator transcription factor [Mucilaginibacter psychrotolerans]